MTDDLATAPTEYKLPLGPLEGECLRLAARVQELEREIGKMEERLGAHEFRLEKGRERIAELERLCEQTLNERDAAHDKLARWAVEGAQLVAGMLESGNRRAAAETTAEMLLRRVRNRNAVIRELSRGAIDLGTGPHHPVDDPSTQVFYCLWKAHERQATHYRLQIFAAFRARRRAEREARALNWKLRRFGRKVSALRAAASHWHRGLVAAETTTRIVKRALETLLKTGKT